MAALSRLGRRVLAACGDGGFMVNSQKLETAARLELGLVAPTVPDDAHTAPRRGVPVDRLRGHVREVAA